MLPPRVARWVRRMLLGLPWGGEPREFVIDLSAVSSRDEFQRELSRHFAIAADHRDLWRSLWRAIIQQTGPYRLRFVGWAGFQERMPRYARRLRRLLAAHQRFRGGRIGGVQLLTVEFA